MSQRYTFLSEKSETPEILTIIQQFIKKTLPTSFNTFQENSRLAVDSILVILGLTELVVAIWSSALGCMGTCCKPEPVVGTEVLLTLCIGTCCKPEPVVGTDILLNLCICACCKPYPMVGCAVLYGTCCKPEPLVDKKVPSC